MTVQSFITTEALPWARSASLRTGVRVSVILAQWVDETWDPATQSPGPDWTIRHNPGNVSPGGQVASYPSLEVGVDEWVATMLEPVYRPVRLAPDADAQAMALGASPWAASHYMASHGPPPGSDLLELMATYDLEQYDELPASPPEGADMTYDPVAKVIHAVAVVNGQPYHWYQPGEGNTTLHFPPGVSWGVERLPLPA